MCIILQSYKFESNSQRHPVRIGIGHRMCIILQSYKFESNSQPLAKEAKIKNWCVLSYKVTNLKAIHNRPPLGASLQRDVYYPTKLQIWKQFTTDSQNYPDPTTMCIILQSYKFESNSQHASSLFFTRRWCVLSYKDTNLKANQGLAAKCETVPHRVSPWRLVLMSIW